jgi:hypothetical protein
MRVEPGLLDGLGEAEVEQLDPAVASETDVRRLEIAVQDARLVRRPEGQRDLLGHRQRLAQR